MPVLVDESDVRAKIAHAIARAVRERSQNRHSILAWGKRFVPDYFPLAFGPHHYELDMAIRRWHRERNIKAAIEASRGVAKSTILTFLDPLYSVCEHLEEYIIILADTYTQAVKHLQGIQFELENNDALAEAYPHVCGRGPKWSSEGILTRNGVRIEPLGAGQKIRGRRERQARPTLIVIDDPEGEDAAYSTISGHQHHCSWNRYTPRVPSRPLLQAAWLGEAAIQVHHSVAQSNGPVG
jgi:hypothetical protein